MLLSTRQTCAGGCAVRRFARQEPGVRRSSRDCSQFRAGMLLMGVMIIAVTLLVVPIYFPMWGGMFCGPREGVVEEDYYLGEFTEEERGAGLADAAIKFAQVRRLHAAAPNRCPCRLPSFVARLLCGGAHDCHLAPAA
jgi:hypothetical protein